MCDQWMPLIELPMTVEQFQRLPRNAAYRYEYFGKQAYLSPRPKHYHGLLDLRPLEGARSVSLSPICGEDIPSLERLFCAAFGDTQPYGSLDEATRREAARQALAKTRAGGDGPWIERASFVAKDKEQPIGAIWITLLPDSDPTDWDSYYWKEPPSADCLERRLGRPHLTWVFVSPMEAGRGVGTALLAAAVHELLAMGFTQMASTFMTGNDSSLLWHWRNGFRLVAHPGSHRNLARRWENAAPIIP